MKRFLPFLTLLAVLSLAACNYPRPQSTAGPAATSLPASATAPSAPTEAGRYHNSPGRFSIKLPAGWSVAGPVSVNNDPNRPYDIFVVGADPQAEGGPGRSLIAILDPAQWDIPQFIQSQCSTCPSNPVESITLAGKPAQRTQIGGGGVPFNITWTFVENNGKLIALAIHDPESLEPLEEIIDSIQFE